MIPQSEKYNQNTSENQVNHCFIGKKESLYADFYKIVILRFGFFLSMLAYSDCSAHRFLQLSYILELNHEIVKYTQVSNICAKW